MNQNDDIPKIENVDDSFEEDEKTSENKINELNELLDKEKQKVLQYENKLLRNEYH